MHFSSNTLTSLLVHRTGIHTINYGIRFLTKTWVLLGGDELDAVSHIPFWRVAPREIFINLLTAFWGLLGPWRDVLIIFVKNIFRNSCLSASSDQVIDSTGVPKDPRSQNVWIFYRSCRKVKMAVSCHTNGLSVKRKITILIKGNFKLSAHCDVFDVFDNTTHVKLLPYFNEPINQKTILQSNKMKTINQQEKSEHGQVKELSVFMGKGPPNVIGGQFFLPPLLRKILLPVTRASTRVIHSLFSTTTPCHR